MSLNIHALHNVSHKIFCTEYRVYCVFFCSITKKVDADHHADLLHCTTAQLRHNWYFGERAMLLYMIYIIFICPLFVFFLEDLPVANSLFVTDPMPTATVYSTSHHHLKAALDLRGLPLWLVSETAGQKKLWLHHNVAPPQTLRPEPSKS